MKAKIVTPYTPRYGEFPDLLFGTSDSGTIYFDASTYIKLKENSEIHSTCDFSGVFRSGLRRQKRLIHFLTMIYVDWMQ